jgi:glycine/D-amino acid oxidase-like deaminating enzyme
LSHEEKIEVLSGRGPRDLTPVQYQADRVVNCAGPWAPPIAKMFGYSCPSIPVRRQVSIFDSRDVDLSPYGMIVDTSGVYFHPEASSGLSGFLNRGEPSGVKYHYDGESFFNEHIWPALYERSTHFEKLRHITGWAGQYEVSPDECAILGQVRQGTFKTNPRVYEAHSFSGHGVMQSYSAGLALAELMVDGRFQAVDATQLNGSRFETGELIHETLVI